jgi:class 3 adenylate cyclase
MPVCPRCGAENVDEARFCHQCATALDTRLATEQRERRIVSVLFADLVSFTSRAEQSDIEDVESFLRGYYDLLRGELERYGGRVEKFIGDAVVAVFGAPAAHEDDAERAVRAGLAIQEAVAELRERDGAEVHVRVGVTSGEVLLSLSGPDGGVKAVGDVVNTAARLQAAASRDEVLVDASTHRATERAILYDPHEPVAAKGKADRVPAWRATQPHSALPDQHRPHDLPLVGRTREVALLRAVLDRCLAEPSTELVTVIGAPGIGKTRLVTELSSLVDQRPEPVRWRLGRSLAYGDGLTFWALGEIVKAEAQILESDAAIAAGRKLDAAVSAVLPTKRDRAWVARHLRPLVGLEGETSTSAGDDRVERFAAWRRFLEALAEIGPTVLVFDDVHWADDALLDFLDVLADRGGPIPLLIVCTARPELLERRVGWGGGKANVTTISLTPLSGAETAQFVDEVLDDRSIPPEVRDLLLARAEGNPLYAQEYVRMLADRGVLRVAGDGMQLAGMLDTLPESVLGVIAARLDTLPHEEKRFVRDAAVVGRTAWIGAVCALSNNDPADAAELLHHLERRQLVRRSRQSSVEGEVEFSFSHALIQDVAYSQIRRAERAEKHERAAAWIRQLEQERDDAAELIAYHYATALRLREQLESATPEATNRARDALIAAGRRADAVNDYAAAGRHYAAAERLTASDNKERVQLAFAHALASFRAGESDAPRFLEAALQAQVDAGDWRSAAEAAQVLGEWTHDFESDRQRAGRWWDDAERYATRAGHVGILSRLAYHRSVVAEDETGSMADALALVENPIEAARHGHDWEGLGLLLSRRGHMRVELGDRGGLTDLSDAIEILSEHGSRFASWAYSELSIALMALADLRAAGRATEDAFAQARRFGEAHVMGDAESRRSVFAYHAGDWATAREIADRYIASPGDETYAFRGWYRWPHAQIAIAEGNDAAVEEDCAIILDIFAPAAHALRAVIAHVRGRSEDATVAADAAIADARLSRWNTNDGLVNEMLPMKSHHDRLVEIASRLPADNAWRQVVETVAHSRYADAARMFDQIGSRPLAAQAHVFAAEQARDRGTNAEAIEHADIALAFYRGVGATLYAEKASELRRSLDA